MKKGILNRNVTRKECPWLDKNLKQGTEVYEYQGCTYGCCGGGEIITLEPDKTPFMEVPDDSVDWG